MPKISDVYLPERIKKRIDQLEAGEEVAKKDISAVLTNVQMAKLNADWANQKILKSGKRATTKEQKQTAGWKSLREVRLEILKQAHAEAIKNLPKALEEEMRQAEIRQMRIYMDTYSAAVDAGFEKQQAQNMANNALTKAGLRRMDEFGVITHRSKRDIEVEAMEADLLRSFESEMTPDEKEQAEIWAEHEKSILDKSKKRR